MYVADLNIPIQLFNTDLSPVEFLKQNDQHLKRHYQLDLTVMNGQLVSFFNSLGLSIRLVEIFYRPANTKSRIHIDTEKPGDFSKLNWVYGGEGSVMNWYREKESYTGLLDTTGISTYAVYYNKDDVILAHSIEVGQPSLVQVGVPHSVDNITSDRFCVSVVFEYTESSVRPTFAEAYDLFKNYIK
jgi:hypothetical protein